MNFGIPCTIVVGIGTNAEENRESHAWNYVQIEEKWFAVDATWDDPVSFGGEVSEESKYCYFLKGSAEMIKDHVPSEQFTEGGKVFSYPVLSVTNYE